MKRFWVLLSLLLALPAAAAELTVSAAASLTESFREIASAYQDAHPGTQVHLNLAASGVLLQQIARGAPVDVLASADEVTMDRAQHDGLIDPQTRHVFASNSLWLVVPLASTAVPAALDELTGDGFKRVAIGHPDSVPAGRYAKGALEQAGLWEALQSRAILTQNVRQALNYLMRGEVDAGFVYATDAHAAREHVRAAFQVPVEGGIRYPLAMVAASRQPDEALRFIDFVRSDRGQSILRRHGFGAP